jgi:hypothetical protein
LTENRGDLTAGDVEALMVLAERGLSGTVPRDIRHPDLSRTAKVEEVLKVRGGDLEVRMMDPDKLTGKNKQQLGKRIFATREIPVGADGHFDPPLFLSERLVVSAAVEDRGVCRNQFVKFQGNSLGGLFLRRGVHAW